MCKTRAIPKKNYSLWGKKNNRKWRCRLDMRYLIKVICKKKYTDIKYNKKYFKNEAEVIEKLILYLEKYKGMKYIEMA